MLRVLTCATAVSLLAACVHHPAPTPVVYVDKPVQVTPNKVLTDNSAIGYAGPGSVVVPPAPDLNAYKPIKIGVVGYGARPTTKGLSATQRHLLGMRAAKLDAYRAIAEQVQGLRLVGNSTVEAMAMKHDGFRTYVDAYLRGVNVVSTSKNRDGSYEARAEIEIDRDFYRQFLMAYQSMQDNTVKKTSAATPVKGNYYLAH